MKRVFAVGLTGSSLDLRALQGDDGLCVVLLRSLDDLHLAMTQVEHAFAPSLVLVCVRDLAQVEPAAQAMACRALTWIGLTPVEDADVFRRGQLAGAAAMLCIATPASVIGSVVRRIIERQDRDGVASQPPARSERAFRPGEVLTMSSGQAGIIRRGVLSLQGFDADGAPLILGFAGAGEAVIVAGEEFDSVAYVGHTVGSLVVMPWDVAIQDPVFHKAQSMRIASMESWARAQAGPHVEARLLHTLRVLARLAGRPHPQGTFIDARITHAHLAAAVAANRSTVTRLMGVLRQHGDVLLVRNGTNALGYCLPAADSAVVRRA